MTRNLIADVAEILDRDLAALADEVTDTADDDLWLALPGVTNPVGALALHLCGNLRHFVGAGLGDDGYVRRRDQEFDRRDVSRPDLLAEILATRRAVSVALERLDPARLDEPMPVTPPRHAGRTVGFFLVQLCCHLSRHRGQLDYLRRVLAARRQTADSR